MGKHRVHPDSDRAGTAVCDCGVCTKVTRKLPEPPREGGLIEAIGELIIDVITVGWK